MGASRRNVGKVTSSSPVGSTKNYVVIFASSEVERQIYEQLLFVKMVLFIAALPKIYLQEFRVITKDLVQNGSSLTVTRKLYIAKNTQPS